MTVNQIKRIQRKQLLEFLFSNNLIDKDIYYNKNKSKRKKYLESLLEKYSFLFEEEII